MTDRLDGLVVAVVVTYNVTAGFRTVFDALLPQVDRVLLIDNGSEPDSVVLLQELAADIRVILVRNAENQGLARAQNRGIEAALEAGASWVLLLDDDSVAAPDMMAAFARAYRSPEAKAAATHGHIAILAPNLRGDPLAPPAKYLIGDHRWRWRPRPVVAALEGPAMFVFASGSLIRAEALSRIGPMREDFFIDYIDIEYGLRANSLGYSILVVRDAHLYHHHGAPRRHRLFGRTICTTNHTPARRFTIFRNRVRVWRSYAARWPGWFLFDATAAAAELAFVVAFEDAKLAKLRNMAAGLWSGLRLGRL